MPLFFAVLSIIILAIIAFFYINSLINYFRYKVPQVATFNSDIKIMTRYLHKYNINGKKLLDMGSGIGKALRYFEKNFNMKVTGYEIDISNYLIALSLNKILGYNAKILRKNYFKSDVNNYDIIYIYLFPSLIIDVETFIWKHAKKGTIIISNAFNFFEHEPIDILKNDAGKEELYIYKI